MKKDIEVHYARIRIKKIRTAYTKKGLTTWDDKLFIVHIDKGHVEVSTSFECTKEGQKRLLQFLKKELYL